MVARELFRRIAFNALISNTDDHPRNHGLIAPEQDWMLSPAYDLNPMPSVSRERGDLAMECGTMGRYSNRANILSEDALFCSNARKPNEFWPRGQLSSK